MKNEYFTDDQLAEASRYQMVIQWSDEDQLYLVSLPEFDNVTSHAESVSAAAERGVELAAEWLSALRASGRPVPAPKHFAVES